MAESELRTEHLYIMIGAGKEMTFDHVGTATAAWMLEPVNGAIKIRPAAESKNGTWSFCGLKTSQASRTLHAL